jgi:hypothetical protein
MEGFQTNSSGNLIISNDYINNSNSHNQLNSVINNNFSLPTTTMSGNNGSCLSYNLIPHIPNPALRGGLTKRSQETYNTVLNSLETNNNF